MDIKLTVRLFFKILLVKTLPKQLQILLFFGSVKFYVEWLIRNSLINLRLDFQI